MKRLMTRTLIAAAVLTQTTGTVNAETALPSTNTITTQNNATKPISISGISLENIDENIRAQDEFYTYVNGKWLKDTEIPADKSSWGSFNELA
ncbi:MAG TPA: hypothetical protein VIH30_01410, partial [Aquirhabdus sp.]